MWDQAASSTGASKGYCKYCTIPHPMGNAPLQVPRPPTWQQALDASKELVSHGLGHIHSRGVLERQAELDGWLGACHAGCRGVEGVAVAVRLQQGSLGACGCEVKRSKVRQTQGLLAAASARDSHCDCSSGGITPC